MTEQAREGKRSKRMERFAAARLIWDDLAGMATKPRAREVARRMELHERTVLTYAYGRYGPPWPMTPASAFIEARAERDAAIAAYIAEHRCSRLEAADMFRVSEGTVSKAARGVPSLRQPVTAPDKATMRLMMADGYTRRVIAQLFDVTPRTVSRSKLTPGKRPGWKGRQPAEQPFTVPVDVSR